MNWSESTPREGTLTKMIEKYRRMTGGQRLMIGLQMSRIAREVAESRIRQNHSHLSDSEVRIHIRRLIDLSRQLEVDIDKLPLSAY